MDDVLTRRDRPGLGNGHHPEAPAMPPRPAEPVPLIVRQMEPENLEFPFHTLDSPITPNDCFFVRCHFPVPEIKRERWRLQVDGRVRQPLEINFRELSKLPRHSVTMTLECAGNSRVFLQPRAKGLQWELGAVGTAVWTGVSLRTLLDRCGVLGGAVDVVFEGADEGEPIDEPKPGGRVRYARSIGIKKAMDPDVLLAYEMNGESLPPGHGFPLRAIVPGYYGMASVKWLDRIVVTNTPFRGYYETTDYAYFDRRDGLLSRVPVTEMQVKAAISRPATGEAITAKSDYLVRGAAWSSCVPVAKVEVSTDGGRRWSEARWSSTTKGPPEKHAWRLWELPWRTPLKPGRRTLMARATDARGRVQPMERDTSRGSYMINHVLPVEVTIR